MSVRSDVIAEIVKRIEGIKEVYAFENTLGAGQVTRDEDYYTESDVFPVANIVVGESEFTRSGSGDHTYLVSLPIEIESIEKDTSTNPFGSIESLLSDIKKAMLIDNDLAGLCKEFTLDGESEADRQLGGSFVGVSVGFTITYIEKYC